MVARSERKQTFNEIGTNLERTAIWPNDPLPPLDEPFLVTNDIPNLDDITRHVVVENFDGLPECDAASEELDHVARFEDDVGIVGLARGAHGHGAVDEVEGACDALMRWRAIC